MKDRSDFQSDREYIAYLEDRVYSYGFDEQPPVKSAVADQKKLEQRVIQRKNYLDWSRRHTREVSQAMILDGAGINGLAWQRFLMGLYNFFWQASTIGRSL